MPTYEITIPGQGTFEIQSDRELTDAEVYQAAESQAPRTEPQQAGRFANLLARGAAGPAALTTLAAVMGAPAGPPGMAAGALMGGVAIPAADLVTSLYNLAAREDVQLPSQAISDFLTRLGYPTPQTKAERMTVVGGEALGSASGMVPAARNLAETGLTSGGRELGKMLGTAPSTQITTAAPSAATAQYVTEETGNPLLGMAAGTAVGTRFGRVESPMPASELKKKAQQAYIRADNAQVVVKPEFLDDVASTLGNKARSEGFVPKMQPAIDAALEEIDLNKAQYKTLGDLDRLRRIISATEKDFNNPDQQRIGAILVDEYDDMLKNIDQQKVFFGNEKQGVKALEDARKLYRDFSKARVLEDMRERATRRSQQFSQSGMDNALRVEFNQLANNKRRMAGFTKTEKQMIKTIAEGGGNMEKFLRTVGKFSFRGSVSSLPYGVGTGLATQLGISPEMAVAGAGATMLTTAASRRGAEALRERSVAELMDLISQGQVPNLSTRASRMLERTGPTALRGLLSSQQGME